METRDVKKHAVVLFDVDGTLYSNGWNGGSLDIWKQYLKHLKRQGELNGIIFHFGIATFKPKFANKELEAKNLRGDGITATILEDLDFPEPGLKPGCGLKEFVHEKLIFFTGEIIAEQHIKNSKVQHAMKLAKKIIEEEYETSLCEEDVFIMDDEKIVWDDVEKENKDKAPKNSFKCIPVYSWTHLSEAMQYAKIHELFEPLFAQYNLKMPPAPSAPEKPSYGGLFQPPRKLEINLKDLEGVKGLDDEELQTPSALA